MQRGELWTLQDRNYASKPRPVVIVQADTEDKFKSIILCLFSTFISDNISTRVKIEPTAENGLNEISYVMTEKLITVDKKLLGKCIGKLTEQEMRLISSKLAKLLEIKKTDIED